MIAQLPALQQFTSQVIDTVFVPKVIARQLALLVALEAGLFTAEQVTYVIQYILSNFSARSRHIHQLMHDQEQASTQDEWMDLAERIDIIQGNDIWRSDPSCTLYEQDRIAARIDEYVHLMRRRDIFELMFVLRGGIGRNKFGLLHEDLFSKAIAGSKVLVETYHNVVVRVIYLACVNMFSSDLFCSAPRWTLCVMLQSCPAKNRYRPMRGWPFSTRRVTRTVERRYC